MSSPIISLENVGYSYLCRNGLLRFRRYEALTSINFSIHRGETLGVVGRNGVGKSTLLRLIAGIIKPDKGQIKRVPNLSVSLLTLQLGFSPELTGRDNAILGGMLFGHPRRQLVDRLEGIKEFSELKDWFDKPLKSYSSGMRARLGFAVAMEMSPDVLLVDEVLGVGDEAFRKKSTVAMKEKMKSGQTVIFVSHQAPTIRELCTSLVWIENGTTEMVGPTEHVLSCYQKKLSQ